MTLADQLRETEALLTPEQKQRAFAIVELWGWPWGSYPPPHVWQEAFGAVLTDEGKE